jgi:hypothetical protein
MLDHDRPAVKCQAPYLRAWAMESEPYMDVTTLPRVEG